MFFGQHHKGNRGCTPGRGSGRGRGPRGGFDGRWAMDAAMGVDGRGARGPGRRRRAFDGGELRLILLSLIAEQPSHGYDLIKTIEERTGGAYAPSPGVVYPTLTMLTEMGLIEEQPGDGAKKAYGITADGTAHLEEHAEKVAALMARLTEMGAMRDRGDRRAVRRAMGNLREVLINSISAADNAEDVHRIVEIIDEAARKIERLD